jgi:hypothetical protein
LVVASDSRYGRPSLVVNFQRYTILALGGLRVFA